MMQWLNGHFKLQGEKKKRQNKEQWLDFQAKEIHIENWVLNFDDDNCENKLSRKVVALLYLDVFAWRIFLNYILV